MRLQRQKPNTRALFTTLSLVYYSEHHGMREITVRKHRPKRSGDHPTETEIAAAVTFYKVCKESGVILRFFWDIRLGIANIYYTETETFL